MFETVKLEKGLYNLSGKSFTQALEALDPSEQYQDSALAKLDAYERQLKRFDIRLSGADCDRVEKFFTTTESAVLFPEFIRRAITQGMESSILNELTAVQTKTNGGPYTGYTVDETTGGAYTTVTAEGEKLPVTAIKEGTAAVALSKFGRLITASYEVIRQQRLDVFAVTLRAIGVKLANAVTGKALEVLLASAANVGLAGSEFTYTDITRLFGSFTDFEMSTLVVSPKKMAEILDMDEMSDSTAENGRVKLPFGTTLLKCPQLTDKQVLALDRSFALELISASDVIMETDKLIDCQLDRIAVSVNIGFKPLIAQAAKRITW